jgi:hypothetical protein
MAVYANTNLALYADGNILQGFVHEASIGAQVDVLDFTTFAAGAWKTKKPGLVSYTAEAKGFQDLAATGLDPFINSTTLGSVQTVTLAPTGGVAVGDPAFSGSGVLKLVTPVTGAVGQPAGVQLGWDGTSQLVRTIMLHPSAARTTTANGTATALTAPVAGQSLYAGFHVQSVSGAGSIVFTVQTDTLIGMGSATTRITSQSFTAVGGQFTSIAGPYTGNFARVSWTITGFTSVTFAVTAGVL